MKALIKKMRLHHPLHGAKPRVNPKLPFVTPSPVAQPDAAAVP